MIHNLECLKHTHYLSWNVCSHRKNNKLKDHCKLKIIYKLVRKSNVILKIKDK